MARVVDTPPPGFGSKGSASRYDWARWFDGDVWLIEPGDYAPVPQESFARNARSAASRSGLSISVRVASEGVYIQARAKRSELRPKDAS